MAKLTGSGMVTTLPLVTNVMRSPGIIYSHIMGDRRRLLLPKVLSMFVYPGGKRGRFGKCETYINRQIHEGMYVHIQTYDM